MQDMEHTYMVDTSVFSFTEMQVMHCGNQEEQGRNREHFRPPRTRKWEHPRQVKISTEILNEWRI
jgi:hypothetical protein